MALGISARIILLFLAEAEQGNELAEKTTGFPSLLVIHAVSTAVGNGLFTACLLVSSY